MSEVSLADDGLSPTAAGDRQAPSFEMLGEFVASTNGSSIERQTRNAAIVCFVDTIGVMLLGASGDATAAVRRWRGGRPDAGPCSIVGPSAGRSPAGTAAMINATAAHEREFDDATTVALSGHASSVLVPTALAIGEEVGASGSSVVEAFVVGYEVEIFLAEAVNPFLFESGMHPTAVIGALGAAAVASRLMGLTSEECTTALAIAASLASGLKANFGTMTKPFHCGWAASSGIAAAQLADSGLSANPHALEASQGFGPVFGGRAWLERVGPFPGRRNAWRLDVPGVTLRKPWPCCGSLFTAIEAGIRIGQRGDFHADDIDEVIVGLHRRRIAHTDRPRPASARDARYSAQFCVSVALVTGTLGDRDFEAVPDERVSKVVARSSVREDPTQTVRDVGMGGDDLGATVTVTLADGRSFVETVPYPWGSPQNPMSAADLEAKFLACVEPVIGADAARDLLGSIRQLDERPSVDGLLGGGS